MRKKFKRILILLVVLFLGIIFLKISRPKPEVIPAKLVFPEPIFISEPEVFEYKDLTYQNPQYSLPLKSLPENYQKDLVEKLKKDLTSEQKNILLSNGALILPGPSLSETVPGFENFDEAFQFLAENDIPIFITSDYILHFFRIELSEVLKNLEIEKISHILGKVLETLFKKTEEQYKVFGERGKKAELARRNLAYLSVVLKLLNPNFKESKIVEKEVQEELSKIRRGEGIFLSPVFSQDCSTECKNISTKDERYVPVKGGEIIYYKNKPLDTLEFYEKICKKVCYFEDYSKFVPRDYYALSEDLKNYYKAKTYLENAMFQLSGEDWTKQAILLTLGIYEAKVWYEGTEVNVPELWEKIYSPLSFFSGNASLNFYDYSQALNEIIAASQITEISQVDVGEINFNEFRLNLGKLKGEDIFKDKGLTILPKPLSLEPQILKTILYKNVGPNPDSPNFREVQGFMRLWEQFNCQDMENDKFQKGWSKEKYWEEICKASIELYKTEPEKSYSVCRILSSNLETAALLDSKIAEQFLKDFYQLDSFCDFSTQSEELKAQIKSFNQKNWIENSKTTWFWLISTFFKEKSEGIPVWLKSEAWKTKELITSLSSFSGMEYKPYLARKESYVYEREKKELPSPIEYSGYLEPNPEFYAKMKYLVESLIENLQERNLITGKVYSGLSRTSEIFEKLKNISEKELKGEILGKSDSDFIKELPQNLKGIIEDLASVYVIKTGEPGPKTVKEVSLEGEKEAFKTSFIRDIFEESNFDKILETGSGKLDWLVVIQKVEPKFLAFVGPIFSYYEFVWPKEDKLDNQKWREVILKDMKRPIWYSEIGISSSDKPYIIK